MNVPQAYGLYRAGYLAARALALAGPCHEDAGEMAPHGHGLTTLERAILELALHDLSNGTPLRPYERFERAVHDGAALLASLGLDLGRTAAGAGRIGEAA